MVWGTTLENHFLTLLDIAVNKEVWVVDYWDARERRMAYWNPRFRRKFLYWESEILEFYTF